MRLRTMLEVLCTPNGSGGGAEPLAKISQKKVAMKYNSPL